MSNTESTLLISIFQKANPLLEGQSTSEYLDYFGYPISETVGTFVRLGLAERHKQSDFGVKLTPRFMRMIVHRGVHRPRHSVQTTTLHDHCLIASIFNVAVGEEDDSFMGAIEFGCKVLAVLGLLLKAADQGWKPTHLMHQLVFERSIQQYKTGGAAVSDNVIKLIPAD
jgi:hypothetical protein